MRERNQKKPKKIERERERKKIKRKPNPIGEKGRKITKILQGVGIRKIRDPFDFLFISR